MENSTAYNEKKKNFERLITVYGRNVVLETLEEKDVRVTKVHMADSNKTDGVISKILSLCERRGVEVVYHSKQALSRISKNAKQDQGVALDMVLEHMGDENSFMDAHKSYRIIALDGVTNPQNLGMIIRSCAAGNVDAILLPTRGGAQISSLVIKASAGTLFKMPIIKTGNIDDAAKPNARATGPAAKSGGLKPK